MLTVVRRTIENLSRCAQFFFLLSAKLNGFENKAVKSAPGFLYLRDRHLSLRGQTLLKRMICSESCCTQSERRRSTTTFASNRKRAASPHPLHPLPSSPPALHSTSPSLSLSVPSPSFHSRISLFSEAERHLPRWHFPPHGSLVHADISQRSLFSCRLGFLS